MSPRGFALADLLIVLAVLIAGAALAAPLLSKSVSDRRAARGLNNILRIGQTVTSHARDRDNRLPTPFAPRYRAAAGDLETITLRGASIRGSWWSNDHAYHLALDEPLPAEILLPPGAAFQRPLSAEQTLTSVVTFYHLSESYYAEPAFFTREQQRGEDQFAAQPLHTTRHPSHKALAAQVSLFGIADVADASPACCLQQHPAPVLFADLSAEPLIQGNLRPGVPNAYKPGALPALPWLEGVPIDGTHHGVLGRDRAAHGDNTPPPHPPPPQQRSDTPLPLRPATR